MQQRRGNGGHGSRFPQKVPKWQPRSVDAPHGGVFAMSGDNTGAPMHQMNFLQGSNADSGHNAQQPSWPYAADSQVEAYKFSLIGLVPEITTVDIHNFFKRYGTVTEVLIERCSGFFVIACSDQDAEDLSFNSHMIKNHLLRLRKDANSQSSESVPPISLGVPPQCASDFILGKFPTPSPRSAVGASDNTFFVSTNLRNAPYSGSPRTLRNSQHLVAQNVGQTAQSQSEEDVDSELHRTIAALQRENDRLKAEFLKAQNDLLILQANETYDEHFEIQERMRSRDRGDRNEPVAGFGPDEDYESLSNGAQPLQVIAHVGDRQPLVSRKVVLTTAGSKAARAETSKPPPLPMSASTQALNAFSHSASNPPMSFSNHTLSPCSQPSAANGEPGGIPEIYSTERLRTISNRRPDPAQGSSASDTQGSQNLSGGAANPTNSYGRGNTTHTTKILNDAPSQVRPLGPAKVKRDYDITVVNGDALQGLIQILESKGGQLPVRAMNGWYSKVPGSKDEVARAGGLREYCAKHSETLQFVSSVTGAVVRLRSAETPKLACPQVENRAVHPASVTAAGELAKSAQVHSGKDEREHETAVSLEYSISAAERGHLLGRSAYFIRDLQHRFSNVLFHIRNGKFKSVDSILIVSAKSGSTSLDPGKSRYTTATPSGNSLTLQPETVN